MLGDLGIRLHAKHMNLSVLPMEHGSERDRVGQLTGRERKRRMDEDAVDFVVAAWREDGHWQVSRLPKRTAADTTTLLPALTAHPGDAGVLGFVSIAEDFFVIARLDGSATARLFLSDVTAAPEWDFAADVLDYLGLPQPADDELDEISPAGDLTLLSDMGMSGSELAMLIEDIDLYPDEVLAAVAKRLGFADQFESLLEPID